MPKWTVQDEERLRKLILEGECLEDIALFLKRSPDAIVMKAKRLGLPVPKRRAESFLRNLENKVTNSAKTTTQAKPLTPVDTKELPAPYEALGLLWAAVKRLQEPDVTQEEVKKLRLIIMGVKGYTTLLANYVYRIKKMEERLLTNMKAMLVHFKSLMDQAEAPEQKALYKEHAERLEKEIAEMEAEGTKIPKKPSRDAPAFQP